MIKGLYNSFIGKQIQRKAMMLHQTNYLGSNEQFSASNGWLRRMIKRNNPSFSRVTSVVQKNPERWNDFFS